MYLHFADMIPGLCVSTIIKGITEQLQNILEGGTSQTLWSFITTNNGWKICIPVDFQKFNKRLRNRVSEMIISISFGSLCQWL